MFFILSLIIFIFKFKISLLTSYIILKMIKIFLLIKIKCIID